MSAFLSFILPWMERAGNDVFQGDSTMNSLQNSFSGINIRAILCHPHFSNTLLAFYTPHKGHFYCFPGSFSYTKYNDLVMQLGISKNFKKKKESALTMRKQMKIAAVVSAAALLALGASITSFAAQTGTWKYEDGEWYCYDRNGDVYENTFCLSNGKEFYVGDDGMMVRSSWVEYDGDYYFVNSAGQKITNDWRLTTPYDDEDAEEQWFYFQSSGKRAENKKLVIKGKTYFFDSEGTMLTGWVQKNGDEYEEGEADITEDTDGYTYYCDETGARLEKAWVETWAPEVDDEDADTDDLHWYYLKSSGVVQTGKASNINGQTYFFGVNGQMLTGWVAKTDSNYEMIWEDDADTDGTYGDSLSSSALAGADVYFCDEEDGHMKKNKWVKLWNNVDFGENDDDNDKYWFYLEKSGKVYVPSMNDASAMDVVKYSFIDGEGESFGEIFEAKNNGNSVKAIEKKINGKTYLFDANGQMISKFVKDEATGLMYYYGGSDDGVMEEGSVSIADDSGETYRFYFSSSTDADEFYYDGAGVNGNKNGKLYENGFLIKAKNDKYETYDVEIAGDTCTFIINQSGSIQSSTKEYEEDDEVLIDATNATFNSTKGAKKNSVTGLN